MSHQIHLNELSGQSLLHKLLNYFKQHADLKRTFHIVTPAVLPSEPQYGETCKLKALSDAMQHAAHLYRAPKISLYKHGKFGPSLRAIAKKNGSAVGEVYSLNMLEKICSDAGFESSSYATLNQDEYILQLEKLINKNKVPIVFFDMDLSEKRRGLPYIGQGENEHAAVVVAYYKNDADETRFIMSFWNQYYDFDGMELALSACHSLKDKRSAEVFAKVWNEDIPKTYWYLSSRPLFENEYHFTTKHRIAPEMKASDIPLRGKIMVVEQAKLTTNFNKMVFFTAPSKNTSNPAPQIEELKA